MITNVCPSNVTFKTLSTAAFFRPNFLLLINGANEFMKPNWNVHLKRDESLLVCKLLLFALLFLRERVALVEIKTRYKSGTFVAIWTLIQPSAEFYINIVFIYSTGHGWFQRSALTAFIRSKSQIRLFCSSKFGSLAICWGLPLKWSSLKISRLVVHVLGWPPLYQPMTIWTNLYCKSSKMMALTIH